MKTPKVLKVRNDRTLSKGYVTLPNAALKDAYTNNRPVVIYIPSFDPELPEVALIWRTREELTEAFITKEWLPHERGYKGMDAAKDGYYLAQMKVPYGALKSVTSLPKYAQKAIAAHQKRTGGKH